MKNPIKPEFRKEFRKLMVPLYKMREFYMLDVMTRISPQTSGEERERMDLCRVEILHKSIHSVQSDPIQSLNTRYGPPPAGSIDQWILFDWGVVFSYYGDHELLEMARRDIEMCAGLKPFRHYVDTVRSWRF